MVGQRAEVILAVFMKGEAYQDKKASDGVLIERKHAAISVSPN